MSNKKHKWIESSGGVVFRHQEDRFEIVICGRGNPTQWMLPKGTPIKGEERKQTALREVEEETGLKVEIVSPLKKVHYNFELESTIIEKDVYFYLMKQIGGSFDRHDKEFELVRWLVERDAHKYMTYETDLDVIKTAKLAVLQGGKFNFS
jgi:8-oxo-dGTP pyrophosphatase MutT (NUDIX family)|tara:strand:+ start:3854 stop:4303 length:450 start_codon:yes stop_codon:yes gene_type:complete